MPLMTNQFAIKVHFYSCLLLSAIVVCRSSAAVATAANDTDYSGYNSSSSIMGSYNNMTTSVQPIPTQSVSSIPVTSSSPLPMSLINVSAITITTSDKVVPLSDVTATTHNLRPPPTSATSSLPRNLKFFHDAPTATEKLGAEKSSTDPGLKNLTNLAFIVSGNATENESKTESETKDKINSANESKIFVSVLNSSDAAVDKKSSPFKRHLISRPSEDASHADRSDKKQKNNFNSNATSNNEIHDFYYPHNFSDTVTSFWNSSVAGDLNTSIVVAGDLNTSTVVAAADSATSLERDNLTNDDESLKNQAVEKYENDTDATNTTVNKYPPLMLTGGNPLAPETGVSVSENFGNPTPSIHSTFESPTPSFATNLLTTTTTTAAAATTTAATTKTTTALVTTTSTTTTKEQQHLTLEQSTKRHAILSRQLQSSERPFNADVDNADKRNEVVTILLLSANETVEELNKSVLQLERKSYSRGERTNVTEWQRSDSLDDATYDKSSDLKIASAEKKTTDEPSDNRGGMTVQRRRRKNARRRKDGHLPFVPVEITTSEPFPTRRHHHHHRYHPVNHHRQQIFPPAGESSFSAEDSGERRDRNSGRNKVGQRRPGKRERARTRDDPSLDIARKQLRRNRLESPKRGSDNSLMMLSSAESSETEEANKYSSSPLVLPPLRNRDPKRQRSSLPSYVHKRSPPGSLESNEITPQSASKSFTFSDCGKDPDRPIKFLKFRLDPAPIQLSTWGGKVKLSAKVNVTKSLPPLVTANVTIIKFVVGVPIPVPCFNHMGSCHYKNLCKQLDELWNNLQTRYQMKMPDQPDPLESRDNDVESDSTPNTPPPPPPWRKPSPLLISPNHSACPRLLRSQYVPCKCPFYPSLYTLKKYIVPIPSLGFSSMFVEGEYEIKLEINNGEDKSQLGCLKASFEMRRRERKVYII